MPTRAAPPLGGFLERHRATEFVIDASTLEILNVLRSGIPRTIRVAGSAHLGQCVVLSCTCAPIIYGAKVALHKARLSEPGQQGQSEGPRQRGVTARPKDIVKGGSP